MARRGVVAIVGSGAATEAMRAAAEALGRAAVDLGARVLTGGRGGVMAAASRGAHASPRYREGDVLAVLPGYDRAAANPWADVVIPTGLGHARNAVVVAAADVVVVVGGGAGTLSEVGLARKIGRDVILVGGTGGVAAGVAGLLEPDAGLVATAGVDEAIAALRRALSARPPPEVESV